MAETKQIVLVIAVIIALILGIGIGYFIAPSGGGQPQTVTTTVTRTETTTVTAGGGAGQEIAYLGINALEPIPASDVITVTVDGITYKIPKFVADKIVEGIKSEAEASGVKEIKIVVWAFGSPVDTTRVTNVERAAKIVTALLEKYGVDVKVTVDTEKSQFFRKGYWTQLEQAFVANQAPDIFAMKDLGRVVEAGYAIQLDKYVEKYWPLVADIYKNLWHAVTYKGHVWAIPQDTEARPLYFRKDVLRKLGWSEDEINALPEKIRTGEITLEDLIKVAKEAKEKGLVEWGFYHRPNFGGTPFIILYYQYGGILQDPVTGKLVLDKQAMLKTLQLLYRMAQEDKVLPPTMIGTEWRKIHTDFVNGRVLFWFGGTWHWAEWQKVPYHEELGNLTEEYEWKNIGFALVPAPEKGLRPMTLSSPVLYYVSSQTKFPETSFILVALATSAPLDARHAVDSGHLPVRITTQFDQYYQKSKFHKEVVYMLEYTSFEPIHEKWTAYKEAWIDAIAKVERGEATPEQALNEMISALQSEIGDQIIIK